MLREIAVPELVRPGSQGGERIETDRFTLCMGVGSTWNTVQRHHFRAEEVDDVPAEVHALLRSRGRGQTQWEVGSAAEPANLVDLLLERGVVRDRDPYAVALVLRTSAAAPGPADAVARRVESFDEYVAANEVQFEAFETTGNELARGPCAALRDVGRPRAPDARCVDGRPNRVRRDSLSTGVGGAAALRRRDGGRRARPQRPAARSCAPAGTRPSRWGRPR